MKSIPLFCCQAVLITLTTSVALEALAQQRSSGALITPLPSGEKTLAQKKREVNSPTVAWQASWRVAQAISQKTGKPIFVYFHASWCGPCRAMEKTAWRDARVVRASRAWVPFKADLDSQSDLAARFDIATPPTIVFLGSNNQTVSSLVGFNDAPALTRALQGAMPAKRK